MTAPDLQALQNRLTELETRLARLEAHVNAELPEVPWHVLIAAVAAVVPGGRIVSVNPAMDRLAYRPLNFWTVGGRLDHFESHRLR